MNKKIKNTIALGALASIAFSTTPVLAGMTDSLNVGVTMEGRLTSDSTYVSSSKSVKTQISNAEIRATLAFREGLKAVIGLELAKAVNGSVDKDDIEEMLEEAYIEYDANGKALIRVGKQQIPFAQEFAAMAIPENDQRFALANEKEVFAIVVQLPKESLGVIGKAIDSLEFSVFETGAGDLDIAKTKGGSFKATRALSKKMQVAVSGLMKETSGDNEYRAAVSVSYKTNNGWSLFAEGQWLDNNPTYPNAEFAATLGASKEFGPGTIVLQASAVDNHGEELGASYHLPISGAVTLSPEVRYNTETEDTTVAVRMTVQGQKTFKKLMGEMPDDAQ